MKTKSTKEEVRFLTNVIEKTTLTAVFNSLRKITHDKKASTQQNERNVQKAYKTLTSIIRKYR